MMYESIQPWKALKFLEEHWPDLVNNRMDKEQREVRHRHYEDAMKNLECQEQPDNTWSGRKWTWLNKCKEIGWDKEYNVVYRFCCGFSHLSPYGLRQFFEISPNGTNKGFSYRPPKHLIHFFAGISIDYYLRIVSGVNEVLSAGLDEQISEFQRSDRQNYE